MPPGYAIARAEHLPAWARRMVKEEERGERGGGGGGRVSFCKRYGRLLADLCRPISGHAMPRHAKLGTLKRPVTPDAPGHLQDMS